MESVSPRPSASSIAAPVLLGLALAAAGLWAYRNSLSGPFVFDDRVSILRNGTIRSIAGALRPPRGQGVTVEGRPVLNLSFALDYAIAGTEPRLYHLTNLLIHAAAGLALFGVLRRTAGPGRLAPAFLAALLWTVHPLQTEAVTYLSQRAESLMGLFYLLTLYCFVRGTEAAPARPGALWFLGSWFACLLGMATKEVMVSAPVIVFLYDRTFVGGSFREAWLRRRKVHLALAGTWILLACLVVSTGGNRSGSIGFGTGASWPAYVLTQFPAVVHYLRLAFWPHPLVFDYGTFWVAHPLSVAGPALLVAALAAATCAALLRWPSAGFLGAFFFAVLAPTSLVPGTTQMIVEHRMYLPLAAVAAAVVFGLHRRAGRARPAMALAALAAAFALAEATDARNADYASGLRLWGKTVAERPDNAVARDNFGNALMAAGRVPDAIAQYRAALRRDAADPEVRNNLGAALARSGRTAEAAAQFQAALRLSPGFAEAHENLGKAWLQLGDLGRAAAEFGAALRIRPSYGEARADLAATLNDLANASDEAGRVADAIAQYEAAVRAAPGNPAIRINLGLEFERAGLPAQARAQYEAALRIDPGAAAARARLGQLPPD